MPPQLSAGTSSSSVITFPLMPSLVSRLQWLWWGSNIRTAGSGPGCGVERASRWSKQGVPHLKDPRSAPATWRLVMMGSP